jgi:hypothetical protein
MRKTRDKSANAAEIMDSASFIDLSDDDNSSSVRVLSPNPIPSPPISRLSCSSFMPPTPSPEEDRRRRREKMAKLHRFLGSHVPASLVLGVSDGDDALPALDPTLGNIRASLPGRRRSSSAAEFKSSWFDEADRVKEELDVREKAINVRRAVKMEKVIRRSFDENRRAEHDLFFPSCLAHNPRKRCITHGLSPGQLIEPTRLSVPLYQDARLLFYQSAATLNKVHI